jgi:hypothetical protein
VAANGIQGLAHKISDGSPHRYELSRLRVLHQCCDGCLRSF